MRFFGAMDSLDQWQGLIASPDRQWKPGYSAYELAFCWLGSRGWPKSFDDTLKSSPIPNELKSLEPLIAIPEYRTWLPPGGHASQSDLFVLTKSSTGLVVIIVEGKVRESFGERIVDMVPRMSAGQKQRLEHLCRILGFCYSTVLGSRLRYQLFHRTASAILEAERFGAKSAMMIVQSFDPSDTGLDDFTVFATQLGCQATPGGIERATLITSCELYLGWIRGC